MSTETRIPSFSRSDLDLPVTWQSLNEVHIPLSYAIRKALGQLGMQMLMLISIIIPLIFIMELSFRPFMHALKPYTADQMIRGSAYVAAVVIPLWLISRIILKKPVRRLQFLSSLIIPLYIALLQTFAGG